MREIEKEISIMQSEVREAIAAGRFETAKKVAEEVKLAVEQLYGKDHPAMASALNNLALTHKMLGETEIAITMYDQSLGAYQKTVGNEHPNTAAAYANLGQSHLTMASKTKGMERMNHVQFAREYLEQALSIRKAAYGKNPNNPKSTGNDDHQLIAVSMYHLASAARMQKKYPEAEALLVDAIAMLRRCVGDKHAATATAINNLGYLYKERALLDKALEHYAEARALREALLGPTHPDTIATCHNIIECLHAKGDDEGAKQLADHVLSVMGVEVNEKTT